MAEQILRDKNNTKIGSITTESNGKQIGRDKNNTKVGEYDPKSDITRDKNNAKVGTGNLLAVLITSLH